MKKMNAMLKPCIFILMTIAAYASSMIMHECKADENETTYQQLYQFQMSLFIPHVYDNAQSLGYRKFHPELIYGQLAFDYSESGALVGMSFSTLTNASHILSNGSNVTYKCILDQSKQFVASVIGDNSNDVFKVACLCFSFKADPSYNIGELDEDNSLYVTCGGKGMMSGSSMLYASGFVAGSIGCGCFEYGHKSPTRKIWIYGVSDTVTDVASVFGKWSMKRVR